MKKIHKYIGLSLITLALASCEGDLAVPPVPTPEGILNEKGQIGQGTPEIPLTVYQASIGTLPTGMEKAWVTGYIVGSVNSDIAAYVSPQTVEWGPTFSKQSNVLLAQDPNYLDTPVEDRDLSQLIAVGFTYGYDARSQLNLVKNPKMLGQQVSVYGTTNVKYFGQYGMKDCTFYKLGAEGFPLENGRFQIVSGMKEGDVLPDGVYSLYAGGYITHTMEASSYFYGFIAYLNGDIVSAEGPEGCFDFRFRRNPDTGYYTIRQNDGRYLTRDPGSANWAGYNFTDDPSAPGAQWTVTPNEDGTFTIKNNFIGNTIQFDPGYSSFGLYPSPSADRPFPYLVIVKELLK